MPLMQRNTFKYSAIVFLGGTCYGVMATTVKIAYSAGFSWMQAVASQMLFALGLFIVIFIIMTLAGKKPVKPSLKQVVLLILTGMCTCTTSILYNSALTQLSVATAITLLFQFTWIGIVIEVIATRHAPSKAEIFAGVIVVVGTPLASGLLSEGFGAFNLVSMVLALLAAVTSALFLFLSGRVGQGMPPIERGMFICIGAGILGFIVCPDYFTNGGLQQGLWVYALILSCCGLLFPVILFGIGAPHIPPGLATIMASAELPVAALLSTLLLPEGLDAIQVVGVIIIMAGIVISQLPNLLAAKETTPKNPPEP